MATLAQAFGIIDAVAEKVKAPEEFTKIVKAITVTEGGYAGAVGDVEGGGSYGPLQFYWQGQLTNFANWLGITKAQAADVARENMDKAYEFAMRPGGYLRTVYEAGRNLGLEGAQLATYVQARGQVSVSPEKTGANWIKLFMGGTAPISEAFEGLLDTELDPLGIGNIASISSFLNRWSDISDFFANIAELFTTGDPVQWWGKLTADMRDRNINALFLTLGIMFSLTGFIFLFLNTISYIAGPGAGRAVRMTIVRKVS